MTHHASWGNRVREEYNDKINSSTWFANQTNLKVHLRIQGHNKKNRSKNSPTLVLGIFEFN